MVLGDEGAVLYGWGEPTGTLVPWRQGFRHPTKNECMSWFAQTGSLPSATIPKKFLGIVGQDHGDAKSNQLHVDIFWFCFIHLRFILHIPLKCSVILLKSRTSTSYFSNSTSLSVTNHWFFPSPGLQSHHTQGLGGGKKKLLVLTLNIQKNSIPLIIF